MTDIRIAVVSLWAEDVPAAAHFYRDVIGLRLLAHHSHERPHFDLGGAYLVILKGRPQSAQNPLPLRFPLVALAVPELDSAVDSCASTASNCRGGLKKAEIRAGSCFTTRPAT